MRKKNRDKKKKAKFTVQLRLNMLFFVIFLLFVVLILRLAIVQIVNGEKFSREASETTHRVVKETTPRGKIYDRNHRLIVDNDPSYAIVYSKEERTLPKEMIKIAGKLAKIIEFPTDKVTERDLKDYWILTRPDEALAKLSKKEMRDEKKTAKDLYQLQLERINKKDLALIDQKELKIAAIFREMQKGYAFTQQPIKNENVTDKEIAVVSERLDELPGVDVIVDWNRKYNYDSVFRSVLGNVSSSEGGLPSDQLEYYTSKGYSLNDRVGKSQLELQYEDVLKGEKAISEIEMSKGGDILQTKVISPGSPGKNLFLTIDMELQKRVDEVVTKELLIAKSNGGGSFLNSAFAVVLNPQTGEILSMSGKKLEMVNGKSTIVDNALGTINSAYEMGSAVKGATILTGFETGAIKPGKTFVDEPIYIKGSRVKKSVATMGPVDDQNALKRSSNVYMFKTAMALMGKQYSRNMKLPLKPEAFETFRYYFSQFGLGVRTGIDLPKESPGLPGRTYDPGLLLDLSIGQFDTYTTLQLAQYISTIANGGSRIKPHLVKEIMNPEVEKGELEVFKAYQPTVLNKVDMDARYIKRVQEGFRRVYQEPQGTAYKYFSQAPYNSYHLAGKTGTAQSFYYDPVKKYLYKDSPTYNLTLVGYAPYENPEVAFAVVVPNTRTDSHPVNKKIGQGIIQAYFELKNGNVKNEDTPH